MKKIILFLVMIYITGTVTGQSITVTESETDLSKEARKSGSYFGGGVNPDNGQVVAIMKYTKKDNVLFDVYRFDKNDQPLEVLEGIDILRLAENLNYKATENDEHTTNTDYDGAKVALIRTSFTGRNVVIEKGYLEDQTKFMMKSHADHPFKNAKAWTVTKLIFHQEDKEKMKFSIMPFATLVGEGQFDQKAVAAMQESYSDAFGGVSGFQAAVKASLNATFMRQEGKAVVIGRVVEEVKIGNPVPWNNNRLRTVTVDGATMTAEEGETIALPFAFITANSAAIADNSKLVTILVPLNSPNTVKEAKQYQMSKEDRNRVMVVVIDNKGNIQDTVEYRSSGNDGNYGIYENGEDILIPALTDGKAGGFWNGLVRNPTHFQITKVKDGKIIYHNTWDMDQLEEKASVAAGEKFKKLNIGDITWGEYDILQNGDMVFFANDAGTFYAFQTSADGQLKKVHVRERYDKKSTIVDSRFITSENGRTFWISREIPEGTQDVEFKITKTYHGDYITTTATPRNFNEIKAVVLLTSVDVSTGKMSEQVVLGGKDYLVIGDSGYVWGDDGSLSFIGHDFKKHKKLYSLRVR